MDLADGGGGRRAQGGTFMRRLELPSVEAPAQGACQTPGRASLVAPSQRAIYSSMTPPIARLQAASRCASWQRGS